MFEFNHIDSPEPNNSRRALGTALDWPDAKKAANQVREWGIEVGRKSQVGYERDADTYTDLATTDHMAQGQG